LVETADRMQVYKYVVHMVAHQYGKTATFMPKPIAQDNGSGMHTHMSIWKDGKPLFAGNGYAGLSDMALYFIGGVIKHARALNAFTNPTTNSYKRLVPGFEAPVYLAWSRRNRSALIRVPLYHPGKEAATRAELRCPDPACNPYLCFAGMLQAGLEGIEKGYELPEPMEQNLYHLSPEERSQRGIEQLPETLGEAIDIAADSELVLRTLGEHTFRRFVEIKRQEWDDYRVQVTPYEIENFLPVL
jgi:glutamine synthetase